MACKKKIYQSKIHGEDGKCSSLCGVGLFNVVGYRPRTQGQWLRNVRGSTVSGCIGRCDRESDKSGVTPRETRLLREKLEQWF